MRAGSGHPTRKQAPKPRLHPRGHRCRGLLCLSRTGLSETYRAEASAILRRIVPELDVNGDRVYFTCMLAFRRAHASPFLGTTSR